MSRRVGEILFLVYLPIVLMLLAVLLAIGITGTMPWAVTGILIGVVLLIYLLIVGTIFVVNQIRQSW